MKTNLPIEQRLKIRASANVWLSENFPTRRKYLSHSNPQYNDSKKAWETAIETKNLNGHSECVGHLLLNDDAAIVYAEDVQAICAQIDKFLAEEQAPLVEAHRRIGPNYEFRLGDGIEGVGELPDKSIDLLLTDPPYGISKEYICEKQVSRRLRKDGTDFIMPKGNFGDWDGPISPSDWDSVRSPESEGVVCDVLCSGSDWRILSDSSRS